jgi:hypothetical protein
MTGTALGLLFAVVGGLTLVVGTYYLALRDQFTGRRGALQVVERDFANARGRIQSALDSGKLWPPYEHLAGQEWPAERKILATNVHRTAWDRFEDLQNHLEAADRDAEELRARGTNDLDDGLRAKLEDLQGAIGSIQDNMSALERLDTAITGARRGPRGLLLVGVLAIGIGVFLLWPTTPRWTSNSLAKALESGTPQAQLAVCDSSATIDGGYTCAANFAPCAIALPGAKGSICSPSLSVTYTILTSNTCYIATPSSVVPGADPSPSLLERFQRLLERHFGCMIR